MMLEIKRRLVHDLREGSRVFSLRPFPVSKNDEEEEEEVMGDEEGRKKIKSGSLLLLSKSVGRATWGPTNIYMYERVGGRSKKMVEEEQQQDTNLAKRKSWDVGTGTKREQMCVLKV
jgi:hypothetical protein